MNKNRRKRSGTPPAARDLIDVKVPDRIHDEELAEYATFPDMNPGPVLRLDRDGVVLLANKAARRLFASSGIIGGRWSELCPEMDAAMWQKILASDAPMSCEVDIGDRCLMFTFVRSESGHSVFAFGADITSRRAAENELHERDQKLHRALQEIAEQAAMLAEMARFPDMNPGPVFRLDLEANVLLANASARRVFGEELTGRSWRTICPSMTEELWARIVAAPDPLPLEARIGECVYVFTHRRDHDGHLVFVFGTNITEQKRAERALRQSEKMATLGTLAAGVAHELNNPAAATRRAAEQLRTAFARLEEAHVQLTAVELSPAARDTVRALEQQARVRAGQPGDLDSLARSDREAEVEEWLEQHRVSDPWDLAPSLVGLGLGPEQLTELASGFDESTLQAVLRWASSAFPVYVLLHEIGQGSTRMSEIVGALKSYSYLGQAPIQPVNIHEGIDNTLIILRNKLKTGIQVHREYGADIPPVMAYGGELNQVWTNLLDNAADAMGGRGAITIRTRREDRSVVVEIEDTGAGIPEEVQSRIFDPFFTTKEPGKGTGLGLSTSYGIITDKHKGTIDLQSKPGCTRFVVRLPLGQPAPPTG